MMPKNYTNTYASLPPVTRRRILATLKKWGGWTKSTAYRKMDGESVTPLEAVMLEGVFRVYGDRIGLQMEIAFEWDDQTMKPVCFGKQAQDNNS